MEKKQFAGSLTHDGELLRAGEQACLNTPKARNLFYAGIHKIRLCLHVCGTRPIIVTRNFHNYERLIVM